MSETVRRMLVGSLMVVIGLGLLEMVLDGHPDAPPFAEVAVTSEELAPIGLSSR